MTKLLKNELRFYQIFLLRGSLIQENNVKLLERNKINWHKPKAYLTSMCSKFFIFMK